MNTKKRNVNFVQHYLSIAAGSSAYCACALHMIIIMAVHNGQSTSLPVRQATDMLMMLLFTFCFVRDGRGANKGAETRR